MGEYKVRYLVLTEVTKQTVVEKINAETVEKARAKAEDLATMRSKKTEKWSVRCVEQI